MQDVQVVRAVGRKERGDERIGDRLERAVRDGEDERAPVEEVVGRHLVLVGRGAERDERRQDVKRERGDDELAVADLVDDEAADDDAEAEAGEPGAGDLPSSAPVKPNSAPQLARMPPRTPKPTPAARMAAKPAQSRRPAFGVIPSCLIFMIVSLAS